jgi:hypothetical protein
MESIKNYFQVEPREISYIRWIIESYDGIAMLRTVDPCEGIIELRISPGCEDLVVELMNSIRDLEGIRLIPNSPVHPVNEYTS